LKKERNADKGKSIAAQIISEWADSDSPTVNLLTQWAAEAVEDKRQSAAFDFLDQAILLEPEYFEAIFARAQLHLADGDTKKAMSDINRVLNDEPRHFLALASMAEILEASGRDELAVKAWERYLDIYPSNREAQKELQDLSEKLAGQRS
jgi:tetratricopeptide (TPR) repeat protein